MDTKWYESFFQGVALDLWRKVTTPEQTGMEVQFLEKIMGLPKKAEILDIPCGNGRHAVELAARGYVLTGVDISDEFLAEAKAKSSTVRWIRNDMCRIDWTGGFDGAFCFGNSFGYLKFPDMTAFLHNVSRALKPGGPFVIETGMAAESILPNLKPREWFQVDDILLAFSNFYHADKSCLETEYTFVKGGKTEMRRSFHWVYTVAEIGRMLEAAGFRTEMHYGSVDEHPFECGFRRLFILARKQK